MTVDTKALREVLDPHGVEWRIVQHVAPADDRAVSWIEIAAGEETVVSAAFTPGDTTDEDFRAIVALHNAAPALLDRIDALEAEVARLRRQIDGPPPHGMNRPEDQ